MKKSSLAVTLILATFFLTAQGQSNITTSSVVASQPPPKIPALDKSPMDVSYFPVDYPILKTQNKVTTPPLIRVVYSRPQMENRVVFGNLVEYNKVWRMGANEATEIEFFKDVMISGKKIPKGRYTIYAIPTETKWTVILNTNTDTWGAFVYDEKKDVLRADVPVQKMSIPSDAFSMSFIKTDKGTNLFIAWDTASVNVPIEISDKK